MIKRHLLPIVLAGLVWSALVAVPGLPLPGADRLGFGGSAAAQQDVSIDDFYDELEAYGQWVWHPRFNYVWIPETVSPNWRPYTVGHWVATEDYGWYWESNEPFAWAVYHYGRWGYDPDYGWFWVPGDTWAPAWVQWRYSDNDSYVGWAPIGPGRPGYAYGVPVSYEPPIAESWVFVQPRYMTSRAIRHYALPIAGLNIAFLSANRVYRPEFRGGYVYNYGMPRDRVMKIVKRPIYVQKIYKVDRKGGKFDKRDGRNLRVYAPGIAKGDRPRRGPKKFVDNPNQFKPKAKLKDTVKGEPPKGWGKSAKSVTPIAKEAGPDAFKKKHGRFEGPGGPGDKGKDKYWDKDKGQAAKEPFKPGGPGDKDKGQAAKEPFKPGGPGDKDKGKGQADKDPDDRGKDKGKLKTFGAPGGSGGPDGPGGPPEKQVKQGKPDKDERRNGKFKNFGAPGGPGGPDGPGGPPDKQAKQGKPDKDERRNGKLKTFGAPGDPGGPNKPKNFGGGGPGAPGGPGGDKKGRQAEDGQGGNKKDKCKKNPDHPSCQDRN